MPRIRFIFGKDATRFFPSAKTPKRQSRAIQHNREVLIYSLKDSFPNPFVLKDEARSTLDRAPDKGVKKARPDRHIDDSKRHLATGRAGTNSGFLSEKVIFNDMLFRIVIPQNYKNYAGLSRLK